MSKHIRFDLIRSYPFDVLEAHLNIFLHVVDSTANVVAEPGLLLHVIIGAKVLLEHVFREPTRHSKYAEINEGIFSLISKRLIST